MKAANRVKSRETIGRAGSLLDAHALRQPHISLSALLWEREISDEIAAYDRIGNPGERMI